MGFNLRYEYQEGLSPRNFWLLQIAWGNKAMVQEQSTQVGDVRVNYILGMLYNQQIIASVI